MEATQIQENVYQLPDDSRERLLASKHSHQGDIDAKLKAREQEVMRLCDLGLTEGRKWAERDADFSQLKSLSVLRGLRPDRIADLKALVGDRYMSLEFASSDPFAIGFAIGAMDVYRATETDAD